MIQCALAALCSVFQLDQFNLHTKWQMERTISLNVFLKIDSHDINLLASSRYDTLSFESPSSGECQVLKNFSCQFGVVTNTFSKTEIQAQIPTCAAWGCVSNMLYKGLESRLQNAHNTSIEQFQQQQWGSLLFLSRLLLFLVSSYSQWLNPFLKPQLSIVSFIILRFNPCV